MKATNKRTLHVDSALKTHVIDVLAAQSAPINSDRITIEVNNRIRASGGAMRRSVREVNCVLNHLTAVRAVKVDHYANGWCYSILV